MTLIKSCSDKAAPTGARLFTLIKSRKITLGQIAFAICALCSCATFAKVEWADVTGI